MNLAVQAAETRSQDPYVQVGACCLRADGSIAAIGYNGPPPGIEIDWSNRASRRKRVIHAEANTLRYVKPGEGHILAVTMIPCLSCLSLIASWGIKEVYYLNEWENADPDTHLIATEFNISLIKLPSIGKTD